MEDKCISEDVNDCVYSFSAAKPLHHHGQECLRLRVDVVAADGELNQPLDCQARWPLAAVVD